MKMIIDIEKRQEINKVSNSYLNSYPSLLLLMVS